MHELSENSASAMIRESHCAPRASRGSAPLFSVADKAGTDPAGVPRGDAHPADDRHTDQVGGNDKTAETTWTRPGVVRTAEGRQPGPSGPPPHAKRPPHRSAGALQCSSGSNRQGSTSCRRQRRRRPGRSRPRARRPPGVRWTWPHRPERLRHRQHRQPPRPGS